MNLLVDTNVISELHKSEPNPNLLKWYSTVHVDQLYTSTLNIAELVYGAEIHPDVNRRRELLRWIDSEVRDSFFGRTFSITEKVLVRWRIVARQAELEKKKGQSTDQLIAAVALENGVGVVSRDTTPFVAAGLPTLNPWTGERFNGA